MSAVVSASDFPISNDDHKRAMYEAKAAASEAKYSQLIPSLVPCPPPFIEGTRLNTTRSNKAKASQVRRSNAVKRTDEYQLTRQSSLVVVESDAGIELRRRRNHVNQQNQLNQPSQFNQPQINNTIINLQNG